MRDPERIPPTLELLHEVWQLYPDQRLGQLILNACRDRTPAWPDVFNVEDSELTKGLEALRARATGPWCLCRVDDNGNRFLVETFPIREAAEAECARYEARGHKQHYWVERGQ